jgi:PAS domain S-box-containing protein
MTKVADTVQLLPDRNAASRAVQSGPPGGAEASRPPGNVLTRFAWVPVAIALIAIAISYLFNPTKSYENPLLLLAMNFTFTFVASLFVSYLLARSFLAQGSLGMLLLAAGVLAWGMAGFVGVIAGLTGKSDADFFNTVVTVHNCCVWLSALLHLTGAILLSRSGRLDGGRTLTIGFAFGAVLGVTGLISIAALHGWMPAFFVQTRGGTPLRQLLLCSAIAMYLPTAVMMWRAGCRSTAFMYWYCLALTLILVGLVGILIQSVAGGVVGWLGRAAQFLSGPYMLVAAITALRHARQKGDPLEEAILGRKRAEDSLHESEGRFRAIFQNAIDAIIVTDPQGEGRVLSVNQAACRMFGYTEDEFVGLSRTAIISSREELDKVMAARKRQKQATGELVYRRKDGSAFTGDLRMSGFLDHTGAQRSVTIIRDVTERKMADEALRRSEARWNAAIESFAAGAIIATEDEQVIYWNPAARAMHGIARPDENIEPLEKTPATFQLWTPDGCRMLELDEWPMRRIKRGETVRDVELRVRRPDQGWEKVFSYSGAMVATAHGERLIFLTCLDLTGLRETETELRMTAKSLAAANRELESFSYSVSHDLRAPLRAMIGFSDFLKEDYAEILDREGRDYLDRIQNAGIRMNEMIDGMLCLSKLTFQEVLPGDIDLSALAGEVIANLRESEPQRSVEVWIEPGMILRTDGKFLKFALQNLIGNAWKYTGKVQNPRIEVGSVEIDGERVFFVRDNGAGFDPGQAEKLFVPFKRLHSDSEFPGTGVGLAIVERVVRRHGGKVWAEGEVGRGAAFYFTLPGREK